MLDSEKIDRVVNHAAVAVLKKKNLKRVETLPYVDADGEAAIKVILILRNEWFAETQDGESVVDTMVRVRKDLEKEGEERQPYFEFVAEKEWLDNADS